ncbi:J domain-containing protein [Rhodanobacter sp. L36]|uniref:J domain-containing protein n=1 Tax=Rhodanobacter sp. L36 TaxID=1747221 RepID=UPI00131A8BF6|nr:J domain-containing protein [Rhodanobacter sp. L36]
MSPFAILGLPADADERSIKQAYAQRLRTTRPDDDPEGFQHLNQAYQAALEHCRRRAVQEKSPEIKQGVVRHLGSTEIRETAPANLKPPSALASTRAILVDEFCDQAIAVASAGDTAAMERWLESHPALWSLQFKTFAGRALMHRLYQRQPAMSAASLALLLRFFDLDHVLAGHDPLALQQLKRRIQLAWELQPEHRADLAIRFHKQTRSAQKALDNTLSQLMRPFRWPQVLLSGLDFTKPARIARIVRQMSGNDLSVWPASIRPEQLRFWLTAADRKRVTSPRLALGATRWLVSMLAAALLGAVLGVLLSLYPDRFTSGPIIFLFWAVAVAGSCWALVMASLPLNDWHSRREELPVKWPWLCLGLVPLLCTFGLTLQWLGFFAAGLVLLVPSVLLMFSRYQRRNGQIFGMNRRAIWITAVILSQGLHGLRDSQFAADAISIIPLVAAAAAMLVWSIDLWRNRQRLRVRKFRR